MALIRATTSGSGGGGVINPQLCTWANGETVTHNVPTTCQIDLTKNYILYQQNARNNTYEAYASIFAIQKGVITELYKGTSYINTPPSISGNTLYIYSDNTYNAVSSLVQLD